MKNKNKNFRYFLGLLLKPLVKYNKKLYSLLSFTRDVQILVDKKNLFFHCHQELISNTIYFTGLFGDFEGESLRLWNQCIERLNPKLILDIGAFTGFYSLLAALKSDQSLIYAYEPNPMTYKILKHNIQLNNFKNIFPCEYGVSTASGEHIFYNWNNTANPGISLVNHQKIIKGTESISLKIKDLLEIRKELNQKLDLIKIDIERAELPLLKHANKLINQDRPIIFCEILDHEFYSEFDHLFLESGYRMIKIDDNNKLNFKVKEMKHESKVGINWIFYPKEHKNIFN